MYNPVGLTPGPLVIVILFSDSTHYSLPPSRLPASPPPPPVRHSLPQPGKLRAINTRESKRYLLSK